MGLFDFLKSAGSKVLTKKNAETVKSKEIIQMEKELVLKQQELLKKQKLVLLKGMVDSSGVKVKSLELDFNVDKVTVYGQVKTQAEKEKVILALGNVGGIATVDDRISVSKPQPEATFYVVKRGDSLSKIAKKSYGDAKLYNKIFEANQPMLKDPNQIFPGQTLRIPPM
ncbi:MAG: nucleoid-associated protein YgaU [Saprospiraceae bacterium]|jgi:nucleoid-associated protein YgaU